MKRICFFLLLSLAIIPAFTQEDNKIKLDSLEILIDSTQSDSLRALAIQEWSSRGRAFHETSKKWAKTVSPQYLRHLNAAALFFEDRKDTVQLLISLPISEPITFRFQIALRTVH